MKMTQVIEPKKNSMNTIIACEQVLFLLVLNKNRF